MTENEHTTTEDTNRTMTTVDHTHPDTDRPFGERVAFERGPTVAADGGDAGAADPEAADNGAVNVEAADNGAVNVEAADAETATVDDSSDASRMRDVDHAPPANAEPNRVFERGREGRDGDR